MEEHGLNTESLKNKSMEMESANAEKLRCVELSLLFLKEGTRKDVNFFETVVACNALKPDIPISYKQYLDSHENSINTDLLSMEGSKTEMCREGKGMWMEWFSMPKPVNGQLRADGYRRPSHRRYFEPLSSDNMFLKDKDARNRIFAASSIDVDRSCKPLARGGDYWTVYGHLLAHLTGLCTCHVISEVLQTNEVSAKTATLLDLIFRTRVLEEGNYIPYRRQRVNWVWIKTVLLNIYHHVPNGHHCAHLVAWLYVRPEHRKWPSSSNREHEAHAVTVAVGQLGSLVRAAVYAGRTNDRTLITALWLMALGERDLWIAALALVEMPILGASSMQTVSTQLDAAGILTHDLKQTARIATELSSSNDQESPHEGISCAWERPPATEAAIVSGLKSISETKAFFSYSIEPVSSQQDLYGRRWGDHVVLSSEIEKKNMVIGVENSSFVKKEGKFKAVGRFLINRLASVQVAGFGVAFHQINGKAKVLSSIEASKLICGTWGVDAALWALFQIHCGDVSIRDSSPVKCYIPSLALEHGRGHVLTRCLEPSVLGSMLSATDGTEVYLTPASGFNYFRVEIRQPNALHLEEVEEVVEELQSCYIKTEKLTGV